MTSMNRRRSTYKTNVYSVMQVCKRKNLAIDGFICFWKLKIASGLCGLLFIQRARKAHFPLVKFCARSSSWEICCRCAKKLLAHAIFYKNSKIWKNNTSGISTYDFAFLRRRSRKLNCRENFNNISSMESIYIINILIVDWLKIQAIKLHS